MGFSMLLADKIKTVLLKDICSKCVITDKILILNMGQGDVVASILSYLIRKARVDGYTDTQIADLLNNNLYAYEYDKFLYDYVTGKIIPSLFEKLNFNYSCNFTNFFNLDVIEDVVKLEGIFKYVVGTPLFNKESDSSLRKEFLQTSLYFKETVDTYLVYCEVALRCISKQKGSVISILFPRQFLTDTCASDFRYYLMEHNLVSEVFDFSYMPLNRQVHKFVCILNLEQKRDIETFGIYTLCRVDKKNQFDLDVFNSSDYVREKGSSIWRLNAIDMQNDKLMLLSEKCIFYPKVKLKQYGSILKHQGFEKGTSEYVLFNGFLIERSAVIPIANLNTFFNNVLQYDTLLFLYKFDENKGMFTAMTESDVLNTYPKVYKYLRYYLRSKSIEPLLNSLQDIEREVITSIAGYKRLVCNFTYRQGYSKFSVCELPDNCSVSTGNIIVVANEDFDKICEVLSSSDIYNSLRSFAQLFNTNSCKLNLEVVKSYNIPKNFRW